MGRYIEGNRDTYEVEAGTYQPKGRHLSYEERYVEDKSVPISWEAASVSRRAAPMIRGAVYQRKVGTY